MKFLITPLIRDPLADSALFITKTLCTTLHKAGHTVSVCACGKAGYGADEFFASPDSTRHFLRTSGHTAEEYLYGIGAMDRNFLKQDLLAIEDAIASFQPDILFTIDRLSSVTAARKHDIPIAAFTDSSVLARPAFSRNVLKGINRFLYEERQEQILNLADLYAYCDHVVLFGEESLEPDHNAKNVIRLASPSLNVPKRPLRKSIPVWIGKSDHSLASFKKDFREAFEGSPAKFSVYMDGSTGSSASLTFRTEPDPSLINGARMMIHDGNPFVFHECITYGVPQIVIHDGSWPRYQISRHVENAGLGKSVPLEDVSVSFLYESYRLLLDDDSCRQTAVKYKNRAKNLPDLYSLLKLL